VLAGVVRGGWVRALSGTFAALGIEETELGILHPRRRFLSGGARSIRGYAENQMGPKVLTVPSRHLLRPVEDTGTPACTLASVADGSCDPNAAPDSVFRSRPLGGNTLLEGSVEYRFPINPTFTGAVFVDAGLLRGHRINFPPGTRTAITPGFGARYQSPLGPVRVDIGIKTRMTDELPVVTEMIDANGEERLVQLDPLKAYDPLADAGAFRRLLGRLQLHLAIGEAF
jgi:outer membrane protein assembly factor BamA